MRSIFAIAIIVFYLCCHTSTVAYVLSRKTTGKWYLNRLNVATDKKSISTRNNENSIPSAKIPLPIVPPEVHAENLDLPTTKRRRPEEWEGFMDGFDWQLEQARRLLEGPGFAPIRMTLWQPTMAMDRLPSPSFLDQMKILLNNALQIAGLADSLDGAPLVQIVNKSRGNLLQLLSRIADGNLAELAGGPLFLLLQDYYKKYGPVFKLAFGPKSFIVVSDPVMVKHILKENPLNYDKGILAEILEPVMGKGLIPADPETWKVRRKAIVPGFHKAWLNAMMALFLRCNVPLIEKMERSFKDNSVLNMETEFCSVSLDIIGKAVFDYDFGSVTNESPVVKAVYRALQEAEHRSTSFIPYWNLPFANKYLKNLQEFEKNMNLLNNVLDRLIEKALATQNLADIEELEKRDYNSMENTSLLRFLVDMRGEDTSSRQLRDDLMTMLIAGHETTAAVLTWTFFELAKNRSLYLRVQQEIDEVLEGRSLTYDDMINLPLVRMCIAETLRMYPEPPLLIRRALADDLLPKGGAAKETFIPRGTDIFIATWNIHRSPEFWKDPDTYNPDRFLTPRNNVAQEFWQGYKPPTSKQLYPNEVNSDFAFMPFGGGSRKCVGDQFAMMESITTIVMIMQRFDIELAIDPGNVGMRTGATIHTENGLMMRVKPRASLPKKMQTGHFQQDSASHHTLTTSHSVIRSPTFSSNNHQEHSNHGGCPFSAETHRISQSPATAIDAGMSSLPATKSMISEPQTTSSAPEKCPFH